eukprot:CAMPEP_0178422508 /NCGR_PEP_ID=MMETSP0689_2-20121128/27211_1 /TAXON_ID=160604 /ORGANISM="Amphidinium massartii, Strain CS-259" /LENGTH=49 /DNA_ID=CAMNT_0020044077 /DNA_START=166 /DNA_END=315 /DNA_ORIENTATION=+
MPLERSLVLHNRGGEPGQLCQKLRMFLLQCYLFLLFCVDLEVHTSSGGL